MNEDMGEAIGPYPEREIGPYPERGFVDALHLVFFFTGGGQFDQVVTRDEGEEIVDRWETHLEEGSYPVLRSRKGDWLINSGEVVAIEKRKIKAYFEEDDK